MELRCREGANQTTQLARAVENAVVETRHQIKFQGQYAAKLISLKPILERNSG
jgi:hypothetical protein